MQINCAPQRHTELPRYFLLVGRTIVDFLHSCRLVFGGGTRDRCRPGEKQKGAYATPMALRPVPSQTNGQYIS